MADESEETPPEDEPVMATADPIPVEEMSRKEKKVAEGAVLAIEGPPEGTVLSIVETMPAAPPMTNLTDTYSQEKTDDDGAGAAVPVVTAAFFTPAQIEVLNAQPMPPDRPATIEGVVVAAVPPDEATPAEEAIGAPLLTTAAGVPVVAGAVASTAETQPDGWQGVKSCDERLLGSAPECLLFLQTHNTRPHLAVNVHGWHRERRTRRTDHGVEHYEITVDDFEYPIDLTNFVYPYGFIQSDEIVSNEDKDGNEQIDDVPGLVNGFLEDPNLLSSLVMEKKILDFDFHALERMVAGYIRGALGWRRGLTVSFKTRNTVVRVYRDNNLSMFWESMPCYILMHLTLVPCAVMRCYRDCGNHRHDDITSAFRIDYAPLQIFEVIKPGLWCTGYRPRCHLTNRRNW